MGFCTADAPETPNPYATAQQAAQTELELYPFRREIERAAALGLQTTIGGRTYDFRGLGEADVNRAYADAMAQAMLDIQSQYGEPFIQARLSELQTLDPEGLATRQQWADTLFNSLGQDPNRPLAEQLQGSVLGELTKGGELDPTVERELLKGIRGRQVARNNVEGPSPAYSEAMALSNAVDQQRAARQQQALSFLSSGVGPDDVQYRRTQQGIGNLSSFMNSESPIDQFRSLASAQTGAAPFTGGNQLSGINTNTAQSALSYANSIYGSQQQWNQNQINPWVAGLGFGLQGAGLGSMFGGGGGFGGSGGWSGMGGSGLSWNSGMSGLPMM